MNVRVAEIRAENHQGDVSARDIEWLCDGLCDVVGVLRQIADPSYVGSFEAAAVVGIYRGWARNALFSLAELDVVESANPDSEPSGVSE